MQWSKERIWEWYNNRPWIRGCNYMSADCANRVDQWQALGFEERFKTTEEELKLINCSFRFLKDNHHIESVASMEFERYANFIDEDEEGVEL